MCNRDWDEWHCNAHSNNLVFVPTETSFLSFLDLDMAFSREAFVNFESGKVGLNDDEWEVLKTRECRNLMEVLVRGLFFVLFSFKKKGESVGMMPAMAFLV